MSPSEDRRTSARILTEFPLALLAESGEVLDDHALAHDVSEKGFRCESQVAMEKGQTIRFRLVLDAGRELKGRARVVWTDNGPMAKWAGAQYLGLSWADKKLLRRMTATETTNWSLIGDRLIFALGLIFLATLGWTLLSNPAWREVLPGMIPKAFAAFVAGWALKVLLTPEGRRKR